MQDVSHRQATARLRFLDRDGAPAARRLIRADQKSHQFLFGCGGFEVLRLINAPDDEARRAVQNVMDKWLGLFNYATLPFYWGRYEPVPGQTEEKPTLAAARWFRERNVQVKGHPLCWHTVCAPWLMRYGNDEILRRQIARIHREVEAFRGVIDFWDVINEVVIMPVFDKYDNAVTRICRDLGRIRLVKEVFSAAKESDPRATLLINDFNTSVSYEILLEGLLEAGVPIGAIGIQSHQHQGYWGLEKIQDVLSRFSRFGLPLHFTENTLISGELMPGHIVDLNDWQVTEWPTTPEGEERQAREVGEMYAALFSHPAVEAITTWDFTDRCWLNAPAGFLRRDDTEKPAYGVLKKLIHGDWETHAELITDENGYAELTGFKGDYVLSAPDGKAKWSLKEDGSGTVALE